MKIYRPGTFDSRIIQYEKVHQITNEQILALEQAVSLKPNQKILDGCCGYGSVTKWLTDDSDKEIVNTCEFFLLDDILHRQRLVVLAGMAVVVKRQLVHDEQDGGDDGEPPNDSRQVSFQNHFDKKFAMLSLDWVTFHRT